MAYLQFLIENNVSVHMVANHISALKANFVMYGLDYTVLNNPRVSYFFELNKDKQAFGYSSKKYYHTTCPEANGKPL